MRPIPALASLLLLTLLYSPASSQQAGKKPKSPLASAIDSNAGSLSSGKTSPVAEDGEFLRVGGILEVSGWEGINIQPFDVPCRLPETKLSHYLTRFGPLGLLLTRRHAMDSVIEDRMDPLI